jgi:hypothetical protein
MNPSRLRRPAETGGITILLALILLAAMTVAAFGLSRNTLREVAITGNEAIGRKTFETADSGLDWIITWGNPYASSVTPAQKQLNTAMELALDALDNPSLQTVGDDSEADRIAGTSNTGPDGSYRVYLHPENAAILGSDLTTDLSNAKQVSELQPSFDLEARYLRVLPSKDTSLLSAQGKTYLWLVRSRGRVQVGDSGQVFFSRREAVMERGR